MSKNIFFNESEVIEFGNKLKDVVDVILTFVKYDMSVSPFISKQKKLPDQNNLSYQQWLKNSPKFTIVNIVTNLVVNEEGKQNAIKGIHGIVPDYKNKKIAISSNADIDRKDISIIEKLLSNLLFDYYDVKVVENRIERQKNLEIAAQQQNQIFSAMRSAKRHNNKSR